MEIVRKQDEKLHLRDTEDESENLVLNAGCSMLLDLSKSSHPFLLTIQPLLEPCQGLKLYSTALLSSTLIRQM